jgi:hypothetical protein
MSESPKIIRKHARQASTDQDIMPQKVNGAFKDLALKYTAIKKLADSDSSEKFGKRCPDQYQKIGLIVDKWVNPADMDVSLTWLASY